MKHKFATATAYCCTLLLAVCNQPVLESQQHTALALHAATNSNEHVGKDTTHELFVGVGKSAVIDTDRPVQRVAVGLGEYAEAMAVSPNEILVNGKTPGETTLILWELGGVRQFYHVTVASVSTVTDEHIDAVVRELKAELPGESLKVSADNGVIFLRGTVKDLDSSDRAVKIASTAGKVVNLLYVAVPPALPQILLKVKFASIDRSLEKQLGLNIYSTGLGNTLGGLSTGQYSPVSVASGTGSTGTATVSNPLNLSAFYPGIGLGATLEALETKGLVQTLAEPNLLAESGKQASFLAGGEYPFPVVQGTSSGSAAVTIEFKEYGVRLNFVPTVTPRGTIHLQLAPEVSSLDFTNAVTVSGFEIPAIDTRKVKTQIELAAGQSFAIGGLLDNRETETFNKIPFIGDIPILGKLFQSMTRTKSNTELIVIVTPEIVSPVATGNEIATPKMPVPFLPPNSKTPMHTPEDSSGTTAIPPRPAHPSTLPVEQLIQSLQPETPMVIDSASGGFGKGSSGGGAPAPAPTASPQ